MGASLTRKLVAELIGSALLLATVVGSGIMAERLSGGNVAIALLGNTVATGAILVVLIGMLGPISGAHFNPVVTLVMWLSREMSARQAGAYVLAQAAGAIAGVLLAHAMFEEHLFQLSAKVRSGPAQWLSEATATFGLLATILLTRAAAVDRIPVAVGLYITAAYWFTSSTSFANPAVTIARSLSNTFAGIRPADVAMFIVAQIAGALLAMLVARWLSSQPAQTGVGGGNG